LRPINGRQIAACLIQVFSPAAFSPFGAPATGRASVSFALLPARARLRSPSQGSDMPDRPRAPAPHGLVWSERQLAKLGGFLRNVASRSLQASTPLLYEAHRRDISRAFDRLGVRIGAPSGPSQPAAKRRM